MQTPSTTGCVMDAVYLLGDPADPCWGWGIQGRSSGWWEMFVQPPPAWWHFCPHLSMTQPALPTAPVHVGAPRPLRAPALPSVPGQGVPGLMALPTGGRGAEVSPRVLQLPQLPRLHRGRGHLRAGGALQALLVRLLWGDRGDTSPGTPTHPPALLPTAATATTRWW